MTISRSTKTLFCAAVIMSWAGMQPGAMAQMSDAATRQALSQCAGIEDEGARLRCYDAVLAAPNTQAEPPAAATTRQPQAPATPPAAKTGGRQQAEELSDTQREAFYPSEEKEETEEAVDEIESTIQAVSTAADGRYVLTAADGVRWLQRHKGEYSGKPRAGQSITVHKAAMGSYICRVEGSRGFRCQPLS